MIFTNIINCSNIFIECIWFFSSLQYFEQDDPDLYLSKVKYILENDMEEMELYFLEEEYDKDGQLLRVCSFDCEASKYFICVTLKANYFPFKCRWQNWYPVEAEWEWQTNQSYAI